jgi:hypothetical protein
VTPRASSVLVTRESARSARVQTFLAASWLQGVNATNSWEIVVPTHVLRKLAAAAALVAASSSALAVNLTPDPPVVLAPGDMYVKTYLDDSFAEGQFFSFYWSGADAFVSLSSAPNEVGSFSFASWSFGECDAATCTMLLPPITQSAGSSTSVNTGTAAAVVGTGKQYYYQFTGAPVGGTTFNTIATTLTLATVRQMAPVPEPSTYALMVAGLGVVGFMARRRKGSGSTLSVA